MELFAALLKAIVDAAVDINSGSGKNFRGDPTMYLRRGSDYD